MLKLLKMKKLTQLIFIFLFFSTGISQQWIDESYEYDSIMDLEYGSAANFLGLNIPLKMDLYLPICESTNGNSKTPVAVFIHGGSFLAGDKSEPIITDLAKSFAKRGYATASINYRMGFVNDEALNQCNFPNYACFFAADTAEWYRAYYRAVQDAKGAIRFLVNNSEEYQIDPQNIFVAGESAGAFIAMGAAFLDVPSEKFAQCNALTDLTLPNSNTLTCPHNSGQNFPGGTIPRPDLGDIHGSIEPTSIDFTIKAVGNFYGGMFSDLLASHDPAKTKPALFQFHQPCDLIVPFESGRIYNGLNWCFTNGYGCNAVSNTAIVHGSKKISEWNTDNTYGYSIQDQFTAVPFPYEYIGFQPKNCFDQVVNGNGCHGYDNYGNRKNQLISFFSSRVTTDPICEPGINETNDLSSPFAGLKIFPNPFNQQLTIESPLNADYVISDLLGRELVKGGIQKGQNTILFDAKSNFSSGIYILTISSNRKSLAERIIFQKF